MDSIEMFEIFKALFAGNEPEKVKELVETLMNALMVAEREKHNGAKVYEHSTDRLSSSNGFKARQLKSRFGVLDLLNPQTRGGEPFHSKMFDYYQRSEKALFVAAAEMYFKGVGTRKVADIFEKVYGTEISPQFVSNAAKELDAQIEEWRRERFSEEIPYIYIDGMYIKVRNGLSVVSKGILIASGVNIEGRRRVLDFMVADTESEATYAELFSRLKEPWYVASLETALRKFSTSNHIERINNELRRRINVIRIFPNEASAARLVGNMLVELDEEWLTGKKYVTFVD